MNFYKLSEEETTSKLLKEIAYINSKEHITTTIAGSAWTVIGERITLSTLSFRLFILVL